MDRTSKNFGPDDRAAVLALVEALGKKLVYWRDYPLRQHAGNKSVRAVANERVECVRVAYRAIRDPRTCPEAIAAIVTRLSRRIGWSTEMRALEEKVREVAL